MHLFVEGVPFCETLYGALGDQVDQTPDGLSEKAIRPSDVSVNLILVCLQVDKPHLGAIDAKAYYSCLLAIPLPSPPTARGDPA
jgi:hypothetical protein